MFRQSQAVCLKLIDKFIISISALSRSAFFRYQNLSNPAPRNRYIALYGNVGRCGNYF